MWSNLRFAGCLGISFSLVVVSAPAAAKQTPITGKLSRPGHSVIAVAPDGETETVQAKASGRFKVRPPARRATLHLRGPDGTYRGPIVVDSRRRGSRAILGVEAGAALGRVEIKRRRGYAKLANPLDGEDVVSEHEAKAAKGVPIGAGVFGRVHSKPARKAPGGDPDLDGVPDPLDVDDDGDLVLDEFERSGTTRAVGVDPPPFQIAANLTLSLEQTANANAAGLTVADIDATLQGPGGNLVLARLPDDPTELDCGRPQERSDPSVQGLVYCSTGGTGTHGVPFPGPPGDPCCFDLDGDGFALLVPDFPGGGGMSLDHNARTDQIGTGDILVARVASPGGETEILNTLGFVFATVPALVSFDDDGPGGDPPIQVSYPVSLGDPGTGGTGFPISPRSTACADPAFCQAGDVVLDFTFWRPQRTPIGTGENREACLDDDPPCEWIDIGKVLYGATVQGGQGACPEQTAFATSDPNLTPKSQGPNDPGGFRDLAGDQPADPQNTFSYSLNVTRCLTAHGGSWTTGTRSISFTGFAQGYPGFTEQSAVFTLP